ncbi:MAG TPA: alpha-E domain-containing protein, partial [Aeromicrobium sp.]|nr:alpha-E domain-containing protein [Aeromicrobium sp.]
MLSRIAESLFWIGRYLERADDTARILDVQLQVLVEDPGMDERTSCEQLLAVMGVEEYDGVPDRRMILELLAHDPGSPASIAAAIGSSREAARRARETLST